MYYRNQYIGDIPEIMLRGNINYTNIKYIVDFLTALDKEYFSGYKHLKGSFALDLEKKIIPDTNRNTYIISGKDIKAYSTDNLEYIYNKLISYQLFQAANCLKIIGGQHPSNDILRHYGKIVFIMEWIGKEHIMRNYLGELRYDNGEIWYPNKVNKGC